MDEEWRKYVGIVDSRNLEVSNFGRMRSVKRHLNPKPIGRNGRYLAFCFSVNSKPRTVYAHAAVAETFIGPRPKGYQVNHKDKDTSNNHVSNLEYLTPSQNQRHARRFSLRGRSLASLKTRAKQLFNSRLLTQEEIGRVLKLGEFVVFCLIHDRHISLKDE